ncbi:hypothetical protein D3C87_1404990 [compost metagenome]
MLSGGCFAVYLQAMGGSLTYCLEVSSVRNRRVRLVVSKAQLLEHRCDNLRGVGARLFKRDALREPKVVAQLPLDGAVDDRRFGAIQVIQDLRTHSASPSHSLSQWKEAYAGNSAMHTRKKVDFRVMPSAGERSSSSHKGEAVGHD